MTQRTLPKDLFFQKMKELELSLTYDDVSLKTGHSDVVPDDVDTSSRFSRNVPVKIPLVSAAMDTVTEAPLAIGLAKLGGMGIIHNNLTPEQQKKHVAKVKHHLNGLIRSPIYFHQDDKIGHILERRTEKGYEFHSFPILNNEGQLVGILTENDFAFCDNLDLPAGEVMTRDIITGHSSTDIQEAYSAMMKAKKKCLPLINEKGEISGMYILSDVKRGVSGNVTNYNVDSNGQLRVGAAVGVNEDAENRLEGLLQEGIDVIVIDTSHGDSKNVINTLKKIKAKYDVDVVVGNVSEPISIRGLAEAGADGIKVGQGPGSICTTRIVSGVGAPQLTAVYECVLEAEKYNVPISADGGVRHSGHIPKAIGAGADTIMMGSLLAGTTESPGDIIFRNGRQWKSYRGMGSIGAMQERGGKIRYHQGETQEQDLVPQGIEGLVPAKGPLRKVILQYVGGLRSGMGYVGARNIKELQEKADFRRQTSSGQAESHPHDVEITKEAPNYNINS